jgi:replicative DNA helicase
MTDPIPMKPQERRHTEAVLLGSLFLHPEAVVALRDQLCREDFSEEPHRLIYEALSTVSDLPELMKIDAFRTLLTPAELTEMGGVSYLEFLHQLAESTKIPIEAQVQLLKRATLDALLDQVSGVRPVFTGIPTGFADLDNVTGLQRSDLVIVAWPPSNGKTSFALSIALHTLLAEHCSVGLFSPEAPTRQVIRRLFSMEAGLDEQLLRPVEAEVGEWQQPGEESVASQVASLWIDDTANLSTAELSPVQTRQHSAPHSRLCPPDAFQREQQAAREPRAGGRGDQPRGRTSTETGSSPTITPSQSDRPLPFKSVSEDEEA